MKEKKKSEVENGKRETLTEEDEREKEKKISKTNEAQDSMKDEKK